MHNLLIGNTNWNLAKFDFCFFLQVNRCTLKYHAMIKATIESSSYNESCLGITNIHFFMAPHSFLYYRLATCGCWKLEIIIKEAFYWYDTHGIVTTLWKKDISEKHCFIVLAHCHTARVIMFIKRLEQPGLKKPYINTLIIFIMYYHVGCVCNVYVDINMYIESQYVYLLHNVSNDLIFLTYKYIIISHRVQSSHCKNHYC